MDKAAILTYMGDTVHEGGKVKYNSIKGRAKGYAIFAEIRAILEYVQLGINRIQVGLQLRQAMFIICVLFKSEDWLGLNNSKINMLSIAEHKQNTNEFLYIETEPYQLKE